MKPNLEPGKGFPARFDLDRGAQRKSHRISNFTVSVSASRPALGTPRSLSWND